MIKIKTNFSLLVFCLGILLPLLLTANHIAIANPVLTTPVTADKYRMVQFNLSWENSWRVSSGPNNWDAAWVFVKYRVSGGAWQHATLHSSGHSNGTGTSATVTPAADGSGAFIYRSGIGSGAFAITDAQLRWDYGVNGVADDAVVDIRVFAIEMVYVPQGAFALGSGGTEDGAFYMVPTTTDTFAVNSEAAITVGTGAGNLYYPNPYDLSGDQTGPVPAAFPKGYNPFYCMKYEISQQQYVDFLNSLTQTQATARKYEKPPIDYRYRYEITGDVVGSYTTTNPYVACNFLSWMDGAAYSDWAGLRPLTELEYEKACRGTLPAVADEYAWGTATIAGNAYTLANAGANNEGIASNYSSSAGNASYWTTNSSIYAPVRVGIFAANSLNSGRITAGASYYGILELSGNLAERAVTIGNATGRGFTSLHGNGALDPSGGANVSNWPGTDGYGAGFRGGGWSHDAANLRVSDRIFAASDNNFRYYRYGFRAARSGPASAGTFSIPSQPAVAASGMKDTRYSFSTGGLLFFTLYAEAAVPVGLFGGGNGRGDAMAEILGQTIDSITVTSPNGGESWTVGSSHDITWTSTGTVGQLSIDISYNGGTNWENLVTPIDNDGIYNWTIPSSPSTTCLLRIREAADDNPSDDSDAVFTIAAVVETVSEPNKPSGAHFGVKAYSYPFNTGGSTSSLGHTVQYKIDWDDGSDSGWLASGTILASHSWAANDTYHVRAMARCVAHTTIESLWSDTHAITISDSGTLGKYNSPAQQKILPEVIWAPATGGGTWMSEVQVTDLSGGSIVSVYYNTSAGRRGPFVLWTNSNGPLRSMKYSNMLQTIDGLDSGVFTYYGTVGAVEFVSQDAAHVLQATARTLNGSYSKTFPAFSLHDANTADTSRVMVITNLTSNSTYRSTVGFFNPTADSVTMNLKLRDAANAQIGSTITKTINGHGFSAFFPFTDAGVPYPANSYDNVILEVQPTSGAGKVLCFGASANNVTNDPAAHLAVQNGSTHDNGPGSLQVLPEAIWAPASGGGTWMSETQIVDVSGSSVVSVYFDYGAGSRRGPFALWTGSAAGAKVKYANILERIGAIDTGFTYYGRVGTLEFQTQDNAHYIQITARTLNGNYSKTFPGFNLVEAETADSSRMMLIQNYTNNSSYRSTCGFFNPTGAAVTVEFTLLNASGAQVGTPFSRTFVGYDFQAFSPFNEAGVPYPANSYDNVIFRVRPATGSGQVVCFGASANNASNDPAAHLAVQGQ